MENTDELIIDETNFDQYFFDVRKHRPKEGQVMAKFSAIAVFGDGPHKHDIIKILKMDKAQQAAAVMQKLHHARMPDCYRICAEMCEDLASGMSDEEVAAKEYEYVLEAFYYTQKELVPKDPHWELIKLVSYDPESGKFSVNLNV